MSITGCPEAVSRRPFESSPDISRGLLLRILPRESN